jgi:hypothetical protein
MIGYLEWGGNHHQFLWQAEVELLHKLITHPLDVMHPFILLPLFSQLILLITLFQDKPNKILVFSCIAGLSLLLVFLFFIGIISFNFKIWIFSLPFVIITLIAIKHYKTIQ